MKKKPSAWLYLIGPAVIIVTSVVAIALFISGIAGSVPHQRLVVPGERELEFGDAGRGSCWPNSPSTGRGPTC